MSTWACPKTLGEKGMVEELSFKVKVKKVHKLHVSHLQKQTKTFYLESNYAKRGFNTYSISVQFVINF